MTLVLQNNYVSDDTSKIKELESVNVDDEKKKMERPKTAKQTLNETVTNIRNDSRRLYKFVKAHIRIKRGDRETKVKEISIIPEDDGSTWAKRSVNSAASRSSIESNLSSDSQTSRDSNNDIVHDINLEHYSSESIMSSGEIVKI